MTPDHSSVCPPAPFRCAAVFGPGLLGGSIALAVARHLPGCELRLWARREQPLELARRLGITEHTYRDPLEAARGADLIVLATPIGVFEDLARHMLPAIAPDAVVTDVGSVKAYVHRTTGQFLTERGRCFIGSHPMAGAETQGLENARAELLEGATVVITNEHAAPDERLKRLEAFWQALGCSTYEMEAVTHDRTVARISHTPHILAGLCARHAYLSDVPLKDMQRLASSGFRDTTRVCSGPPAMWADILWENDVAIRQSLSDTMADLRTLMDLLENQDREGVREWLEKAKLAREVIRSSPAAESPESSVAPVASETSDARGEA